jgi:hypothetical protein
MSSHLLAIKKIPLYSAIYVNESLDDEVEQYFQTPFFQKLKVNFLGDAEWYLGMKFDWNISLDGSVTCRISQEGYAADANKYPLMTPFRSGLPIDAVPSINIRVADQKKIGFGPVHVPTGPLRPRSDRWTDRFETARTAYSLRTASLLYATYAVLLYCFVWGRGTTALRLLEGLETRD